VCCTVYVRSGPFLNLSHMDTARGSPVILCAPCHKNFQTQAALDQHVSNSPKHKCSCGETVKDQGDLHHHLKTSSKHVQRGADTDTNKSTEPLPTGTNRDSAKPKKSKKVRRKVYHRTPERPRLGGSEASKRSVPLPGFVRGPTLMECLSATRFSVTRSAKKEKRNWTAGFCKS
jgi:hypothetical protein